MYARIPARLAPGVPTSQAHVGVRVIHSGVSSAVVAPHARPTVQITVPRAALTLDVAR